MRLGFSTRIGRRGRVYISSGGRKSGGGLIGAIVALYAGIFKGFFAAGKWVWTKARWVPALLFAGTIFDFIPKHEWGPALVGLGLGVFFGWPYIMLLVDKIRGKKSGAESDGEKV